MLKYREIQSTKFEPAEAWCNMCGLVVDADNHPIAGQFATIDKTYGYGSPKDGDRYVAHFCEPCTDRVFSMCKIPPQIVSSVVWGEEPEIPKQLVSETRP